MERLCALIAIFLSLLLWFSNYAHAQYISNDTYFQQSLSREKFLPGGKYFGFSGVRGTLDPSSYSGYIKITPSASVQIGGFSLESANIVGMHSYTLRFKNHLRDEHMPFTINHQDKGKDRINWFDGSQSSFYIKYTGNLYHPADGYDKNRVSNEPSPVGAHSESLPTINGVRIKLPPDYFPSPTGARDEYTYTIEGIATGIYLLPNWKLETPGFWERFLNARYAIERNAQGGIEKFLESLVPTINGVELRKLMILNGLFQAGFSIPAGLLEGFLGPELEYSIETAIVSDFRGLDVETQYASLDSFQIA